MSDAALSDVLTGFVEEVVSLRMEANLPEAHATTELLLDSLLDVRQRLDRVEFLLGEALRVRGFAQRKHAAVQNQAKDAWDEAAVRQRASTVRDEYSSALERTAATNLEVLDLRRAARATDADARLCDEAVETIRLHYRGLADLRQDVLTIIRSRQFESTLDR